MVLIVLLFVSAFLSNLHNRNPDRPFLRQMLRNHRPSEQILRHPFCKQWLHRYHPLDPVRYYCKSGSYILETPKSRRFRGLQIEYLLFGLLIAILDPWNRLLDCPGMHIVQLHQTGSACIA